jgi:multisubunit Na+/H+ antiporter MnhG subunit
LTDVLVWILVVVAFLTCAMSVLGVLLTHRSAYDGMHFTGPASSVAPLALALAVLIDFGPLSQAGVKAVIVAVLLILLNAVVVHATARALRVREHGRWGLLPEERRERGE